MPASHEGEAQPVADEVKIWGLDIEGAGLVNYSFSSLSELTDLYANRSDIEVSLMRHQMFAGSAGNIPGKEGATFGLLYAVNFMPANVEIPLEIKWLTPDGKVACSKTQKVKYMTRYVEAYTIPPKSRNIFGSWTVQFFYGEVKVREEQLVVKQPKQVEANASENKAIL
jgi:hypothetical protein